MATSTKRLVSAGELARLSAAWVNHHLRCEVEDPDGLWRDVAALGGADWLDSARVSGSLDQPALSGVVNLRRDAFVLAGGVNVLRSLAPLVQGSTINRNAASAYAPMLDPGRRLRLSVAATSPGRLPATNLLLQARNLTLAPWAGVAVVAQDAVGLDGQPNTATTITDNSATLFHNRQQNVAIPNDAAFIVGSVWLAKDNDETRFPQVGLLVSGGAVPKQHRVSLNTKTGAFVGASLIGGGGTIRVTDTGSGDWLVEIVLQNTATGNTIAALTIYAAARSGTLGSADNAAVTGSVVVRHAQVEYDRTSAGDPVATGAAAATQWRELVTGKIDKVGWPNDPIDVSFRDLGARILDTFIDAERSYGHPLDPTPIETVMASLLADNPVLGAPALYVPAATGAVLTGVKAQEKTSLMSALVEHAQRIGWDVRYLYGPADDVMRLTLYQPSRTEVVPDYVVGPGVYRDVRALEVSDEGVRNLVRVRFHDRASGTVMTVERSDVASIAKHGRRLAEFDEGPTSPVDSAAKAGALADAALSDLVSPWATMEVESLLYWPVQVNNLVQFDPNDTHHDTPLVVAVEGFAHDFRGSESTAWTTITGRGKPATAYRRWQVSGAVGPGVVAPPPKPVIVVRQLASTTNGVANFEVSASAPDGSAVALFYAIGDDAMPGASNLANPGTVPVLRTVNTGEDWTLRVRAVSAAGAAEEQFITVDFDVLPELVHVTDPQPVYDGQGAQTGWRLRGSVDDDARAVAVALTGALVHSDAGYSPAPSVVGGVRWLDLSSQKTFTVEVAQGPGETGTVTLTAYEKYDAAAPGVAGQPHVRTIARAPITVASVGEPSPTRRDVAITATPATATVYALVAGTTYSAVGGLLLTNLDVDAADVVVEYWGMSASGVAEDHKRLVLDRDLLPEVTALVLSESAANVLTVSVDTDEDLFMWRAWARRGALPLQGDGVTPDNAYQVGPTWQRDTRAFTMRADGAGADPGDRWYVIVRGYDYAGNFDERSASLVVAGAPTPALSNVRGWIELHTGAWYNEVAWDSNAALESAGWSVTIRENGVQLVAGRDPRLDHLGALAPANAGGYHRGPMAYATDPGAAYARYLAFNYVVELRDAASVVKAQHSATVAGYYFTRSGLVRAAPVAAAPVPSLTSVNAGARSSTWNTGGPVAPDPDTDYQIQVSLTATPTAVLQETTYASPPATHAYTRPPGSSVETFRLRARWRNYAGDGPWSAYSGNLTL